MTTQNEDYQPCSARTTLVQYSKDGTKARVQRCSEKSADMMGKNVTPDDCSDCPVRHMITVEAMKNTSYRPPMVAEVATVKEVKPDRDPPKPWLPCVDRNEVNIGGCCGQSLWVRVCDSVDCFRLGSQVTHEMCLECPHRK